MMTYKAQLTDQKHPLPALKCRLAMQSFIHSSHHDSSEHATDLADRSEDSSPLRDFQRLVPGAKNVDRATVQT